MDKSASTRAFPAGTAEFQNPDLVPLDQMTSEEGFDEMDEMTSEEGFDEPISLTEGFLQMGLVYKDIGKSHVLGAPVVEIRGVSIHSETDCDDPFEIYGYIRVVDGRGDTFEIYDQPKTQSDSVCFGDELLLLNVEPVFSPFPITKIIFNLIDKNNNLELIDDTITLDCMEKIFFEKMRELTVTGKNCYLTVSFITFEAAVLALINMKLFNDSNDNRSDDHVVDVFADISVSFESNYSFLAPHHPHVELLSTDDCPVKVKIGTSIYLDKSIVVVPAYASLKIQASLYGLVTGTTIFPANHVGLSTERFEGSNGYYVYVTVQWRPGNPRTEMERQICSAMQSSDDSRAFSIDRWQTTRDLKPMTLMEVYSIVVIPDEKINQIDVLSLFGEIFVEYSLGVCHLFQRTESDAESFHRGECNTIALEGPFEHCFSSIPVILIVKLKDVRGISFCHGFVDWNDYLINDGYSISWYKRRKCSIIQGDYGLVKVHYSIFQHAVQATVMALFSFYHIYCEADTNVSGSIVASYGNYDYSPYDEEYYRSVLFLKSQESPMKLSGGRKISLPLLKSVISVPIDTFLTIEIDLSTTAEEGHGKVPLQVVAKFEVGDGSCYKLKNEFFSFDLIVGW